MDREPEPPEGRNSSSSVAVSVCCLGAWELGLDRPAWNRFPLGPWPSGARGGAQPGAVRCGAHDVDDKHTADQTSLAACFSLHVPSDPFYSPIY